MKKLIKFMCFDCKKPVSLRNEHKALAWCKKCGAIYKLELGVKEIWKLKDFTMVGDTSYIAIVERMIPIEAL